MASGDGASGLLWEDDFSSYKVGTFPGEKWTAQESVRPLVTIAGLSSPVGMHINSEGGLVTVEPRVGENDAFVFEWRACDINGQGLCVTARSPAPSEIWGISVTPMAVEFFDLGKASDPFAGRSVRVRASIPARNLYAEHDYLLFVRPGEGSLFCDGQLLVSDSSGKINGGVPQLTAVPGTWPLFKHVRLWAGTPEVLGKRLRVHRAAAPLLSVGAKRLLPEPMPPRKGGELVRVSEERPFDSLFPRSSAPAAELHIVRADRVLQRHGAALFLTLTSLQGLVNRVQPRIYLQTGPEDLWPMWLKERGDVSQLTEVSVLAALFEEFREYAEGAVVVDPRIPASINVATAIASVENLVVVHPDFAAQLPWSVRHDLSGRWVSNVDAYRWAYTTYWKQMNHHVLGCANPLRMKTPRDYLVAFRIFPFYITGRGASLMPEANPETELQFAEELLASTPPNVPVMGWESDRVGIGEHDAVRLFSNYGKFLVACDDSLNLTVHSGTRRSAYRQPSLPSAGPLDRSKVYVSFTMSDGDNLNTWFDFFRRYFEDPARGRIPIGWTLGPCVYDLVPDLMDWYYSKLLPSDRFICASGPGYIYPDEYARMYRDRPAIHQGFVRMTGDFMRHMDMGVLFHLFSTFDNTAPGKLRKTNEVAAVYARGNPWLTAILCDYGAAPYCSYEAANSIMDCGVPLFHAAAPTAPWRATTDQMIQELRQRVGSKRPAFAHVFCYNWKITPTMIRNVAEALGEDFVAVLPDELARLYKEWRSEPQRPIEHSEACFSPGAVPLSRRGP
jgi:hypothetical protein